MKEVRGKGVCEEEDSRRRKDKITLLKLTYLILKKKIFYIYLLVLYNYSLFLICEFIR